MRPRTTSIATVATILAVCALRADAGTPVIDTSSLTKTVDYSDLDLHQPKHVAALYRRIANAATVVCKPLAARDMPRSLHYRKCLNDSIEHAIDDVHEPLLSEHYANLSGPRILSPLLTPLNR